MDRLCVRRSVLDEHRRGIGRHDEEIGAELPRQDLAPLIADAILDCSSRGGLVLDCFLGSGTTLIAAEKTGRRAAGMELDPAYVDTALRRWQAFTGREPVHGITGRTFLAEGATRRETGHA